MKDQADVIRIVPTYDTSAGVTAAPLTAPSGANLTYRGGPLLTSVEVFTLFWGSAWQSSPQSDLVGTMNQFFDYVVASPLLDQLAEYGVSGQSIQHGSRIGTLTLTMADPAAVIVDGDIQQMLQTQIPSNTAVPQPGANSLYFIFLAPGVTVSLGGGSSCSQFCGYHDAINGQIFYAVMPYADCDPCRGGLALLDVMTSTSSHELCEAITDPVPGQGWYDDANGEIGDICAWQTKQLGQYVVQLEWSNAAGSCV